MKTSNNNGRLDGVVVFDPARKMRVGSGLAWRDGTITEIFGDRYPLAPDETWVIPAGTDAHVHLTFSASSHALDEVVDLDPSSAVVRAASMLDAAASHGIAAVRDLGAVHWAPRRTTGRFGLSVSGGGYGFTCPDGHGKTVAHEVDEVCQLVDLVAKERTRGVDWLKVFVTGGLVGPGSQSYEPNISTAILVELVRLAHDCGARVAAHVHGHQGIQQALDAGVDSIEHGSGLLPQQAGVMASRGVLLVPTLLPVMRLLAATPSNHPRRNAMEAVRQMQLQAIASATVEGVMILAGTDAGTPYNPIGGLGAEMYELVQAGVDPNQALRAGTDLSAQVLEDGGLGLGHFCVGAPASFITLGVDPRKDLRVFDQPTRVIINGVDIPAASNAPRSV